MLHYSRALQAALPCFLAATCQPAVAHCVQAKSHLFASIFPQLLHKQCTNSVNILLCCMLGCMAGCCLAASHETKP